MDVRSALCLTVMSLLAAVTSMALGDEAKPVARAQDAEAKALEVIGRMVGGKWEGKAKGTDGKPFVEFRYTWGPDQKSVRGAGRIVDMQVESRFAWDPAEKKVYYLDSHGPNTIYFGHLDVQGEELVFNYKTLVGAPGTWMARAHWSDKDTYHGHIESVKDGKPAGDGQDIELHRVAE